MKKTCSKCKLELEVSMFGKNKASKDGLKPICRDCKSKEGKKYRAENTDKERQRLKKYREENYDKCREREDKYYKDNIEKEKKRHKKYCKENPEKRRETCKKYVDANPEKEKERYRKYQKENKDKVNLNTQTYQAKKRLLPSTLTSKQWKETKTYFNNKCCYCGQELPLQMEHFIPVTKGGGYIKENIISSCSHCNYSKHNYDFKEWYIRQNFYNKERETKILEYINLNKQLTPAI